MADDLGYTDLGAFGGEIKTPQLDALAAAGVRLTQFYSAPTCSPTRAMLMSGTDHHLAGLGNMSEELRANQKGHPGYEGYLNTRVAALPELLRAAGYHTYMTGKWHLGVTAETSPAARGFERSFALTKGGAGHFSDLPLVGPAPATFREDGVLAPLPGDFYSSRFYSERLIEYLEDRPADGRPFFAYLAYTAPHWPLQAPAESIAKYAGRYDAGYEAIQAARMAKMRELGLLLPGMQATPQLPSEPAWERMSPGDRRIAARKMEIYAAMIDDLDRYLGKVLDALKRRGEFDDTFIFFMSDNGAEGAHLEVGWDQLKAWIAECCDNGVENMGRPNSYLWTGPDWARVSAAPFRMFKAFTTEGGIRVPAIVHYPKLIPGGGLQRSMSTVMDVLPTLLELAGIEHPRMFQGREVLPLRGTSLLPALTGARATVHGDDYVMGWELFGRRSIRQGDWKIVWEPVGIPWAPRDSNVAVDRWRLYHIGNDPGERIDLTREQPDRLRALISHWENYARETGVVLPDYSTGYAP